ncbi:glycoside hydrolase family 3 C-terminal domain-containing protein [Arthrobacter sp. Sa2CUA1]|uniref:Glycoside hydrolase family 3 C-terminal domain-containing protein n=1 Tax=Arthrobacter gallicola TaxID=2762225 RepID=A0ABR8UVY4_9MICC|nr:glycoside hydrolase family 3 C-terminal domain-containing protein [Arthrobacter gallicola]MBD7996715.1 glycoside hydrolase family 3 C-terminal domain-containing protein [Arthrobacter gallicola]
MTSVDISALTLEQKASLLSGQDFWSTKNIDDAGIPSIVLADGPHGIRRQDSDADHLGIHDSLPSTCFPPAVAVGSSWDPAVAAKVGAAVGREALALGVSVVLGPGVNIKRSPLCGRNFEYYSEDPLLSGVLGAAHVTGLQETGPGASVKHFAANNQETERMRISADVDERTLREIYFPAFERVVTEARPATVMCSYNKVNGVYASHNKWLLTDVLRGDWAFEGAVVSDWGAVSDRVAGVEAGMDLEMPGSGGATDQQIIDAVREGRLTEDQVDDAVKRVVALTSLAREATGDLPVDRHHTLARTAAAESIVLLKNGGALPLRNGQHIAVIGPFAVSPRFQGGGSSHINATRTESALEDLTALAGERNATVDYAPGFSLEEPDTGRLKNEAEAMARSADVAVVFAGLSDREESEGFDREGLELPSNQIDLIRAVAAAAPKTVVVLSNGGVVSLEGWHDDVHAVVEGWLLGQASGGAIADVLFGVVNPSGRLAETIPLRLEDNPSWLNFPGEQGHVRYGEGVLVGYRYYTTAGVQVRYPFGHGLSYTTFETSDLELETLSEDTVTVHVTVTNTGDRAGKHVVQVYVATTAGPVRRPARELRAFTKVSLEAGESKRVALKLDRRAFAYWDIQLNRWVVPAGNYAVQVCSDAFTVLAEQEIALAGDSIIRELTMDSTVGDWFAHPVVGPQLEAGLAASLTEEQAQQAQSNSDHLKMVESMPMQQFLAFTNGAFPAEVLESLMELSKKEA